MANGNGAATITYRAVVLVLTSALLAIIGLTYSNMAEDIKQLQFGQAEIRRLISKKGDVSNRVPMTTTLDDILDVVKTLQTKPVQPQLGIQN